MRPRLHASPRLGDALQRQRLHIDSKFVASGRVEQLRVRLSPDIGRCAEIGVPHDHEHLPPDWGRRQRRLRARRGAQVHEARFEARGLNRRGERLAEQRIDDDVDAAFGRLR